MLVLALSGVLDAVILPGVSAGLGYSLRFDARLTHRHRVLNIVTIFSRQEADFGKYAKHSLFPPLFP
jgi:hypothetical protein